MNRCSTASFAGTFNRTIVELKQMIRAFNRTIVEFRFESSTFNRTIVELKLYNCSLLSSAITF